MEPRKTAEVMHVATMNRRTWCLTAGLGLWSAVAERARAERKATGKEVVLTFDDAVKSHRTIVAPLLKDLGFQASFFISQLWMNDKPNFLTWEEVAEIHGMGFEIGNHSWTHSDFSKLETAAKLGSELRQVEAELKRVGVEKPVSFAWCGNGFGPEGLRALQEHGYRYARRGMQPEIPYGKIEVGPAFDPARHHPLLIPTTGDAYPDWTLDHFKKVAHSAKPGELVVLQFHGVPDIAHPWVHTPPERFREYMNYLHAEKFTTLALRDVQDYLPQPAPEDPLLSTRFSPSLARIPGTKREE